MVGLFLDDLIIALYRFIRGRLRLREALKWPKVEVSIHRVEIDGGVRRGTVILTASYHVDGTEYVAKARSGNLLLQNAEACADPAEGKSLCVRYNPADPSKNRALFVDNPHLFPFPL